jgi:acetyl-CoA acetyltransferase
VAGADGEALSVSPHPYHDVAIVGVHNTTQARRLPDTTMSRLLMDAVFGACADAGVAVREIDAFVGQGPAELTYDLGLGPGQRVFSNLGIPAIRDAAHLIATGQATTVVVVAGGVGLLQDDGATAPWTRPTNELVVSYGLFTAAEFALMARRHMIDHGTTTEQLATVAATIRNNGHVNPAAVYHGRGPFTAADILDSPMIADPFHLLDCSMTCEGGTAMVLTTAERAADLAQRPVYIHGSASDSFGPAYSQAPSWDLRGVGSGADVPAGYVGRRAARIVFRQSGLGPADVDVCEFYDPFSFEIIRQFEAFEFCGEGEGGALVMSGAIGPGGRWPVTTDGGTMSFSHAGISTQQIQRVGRGVEQLRGTCETMQVPGAEVALCSNGGSGALFTDLMLLGVERP